MPGKIPVWSCRSDSSSEAKLEQKEIGTDVEHRTTFLPVLLKICGEFHTQKNVFRHAFEKLLVKVCD